MATTEIFNRKASYNYFLLETLTAGIQLTGPEIKSIRAGQANLRDAYCYFRDGELFVKNLYIKEYENIGSGKQEPLRDKKLLLHRHELRRWEKRVKEKGLTIIPVRLYINEKGYAKLEISLAAGKKAHDKSEALKERDLERALRRELRRA
ncbi:MAG: SsrA-binding protein SmpB [Flavobacteriales bacterium]|nr:SsrA-binding protein SmpB [Flavobacteriales bacterium]